jgi:choline transporter-like protein 2/4/5
MVLAGIFSVCYWNGNEGNISHGILFECFTRTVVYHLGTLCFGSLILTIVSIIRAMINKLRSSLVREGGDTLCLCWFACCISCLEDIIKEINRRAYIWTAIHGTDFMTSTKTVFYLVWRNLKSVYVLDWVVTAIFFMMTLLMALVSGVIFSVTLHSLYPHLGYGIIISILYGFLMFCICLMFLKVLGTAVSTIFICFLEDIERNDGSKGKPYHMWPELKDLFMKDKEATDV